MDLFKAMFRQIKGDSMALLMPDNNLCLGWSDHKWTALNTGVNAPKTHWDPATETTVRCGLGCKQWAHKCVLGHNEWPPTKLTSFALPDTHRHSVSSQKELASFVYDFWKFQKACRDILQVCQNILGDAVCLEHTKSRGLSGQTRNRKCIAGVVETAALKQQARWCTGLQQKNLELPGKII